MPRTKKKPAMPKWLSKGGKARAKKLSAEERQRIARMGGKSGGRGRGKRGI